MPTESYILNHDLWKAWQAVCLNAAGLSDLADLAHYDIDPLADDAEEWIIEAINDQCVSEAVSSAYKIEREAA